MHHLSDPLDELKGVSQDVAWKLIDTLFRQVDLLVIAAATFTILGLIGFGGTGRVWYLDGAFLTIAIAAFRLWQIRSYRRRGEDATPTAWARRGIAGAWMTAAGWGLWSLIPALEADKSLVLMFVAALTACMLGAAVRNCAIRIIPQGQALLTLTPLFVSVLESGDPYLRLYAFFIVLHFGASLSLISYLHQQMLQVFLQDEEKTELVRRLAAVNQQLEVSNKQLERLAGSDALTGIANRRTFDTAAASEWLRAARNCTPLSLLLLDIDYFKKYNDFYGHQAGDACLHAVAAAVAQALRRPGDIVARYGGEEFAVILQDVGLVGACHVGEQILSAVSTLCFPHADSPFKYVTVSIGAATMIPNPNARLQQLIADADAALYTAKRSGRNRVSSAEQQPVGSA